MKLENQVSTEEQGMQFMKYDIVESFFCWAKKVESVQPSFDGEQTEYVAEYSSETELIETSFAKWDGRPYCPAFSVAELGLLLPYTPIDASTYFNCWRSDKVFSWAHYENGFMNRGFRPSYFQTEAQAKADMLIYILNKKYATPSECNKRLLEA